ncbi:hypothetical protein [Photobacterium sp. 1_MG-2023]|uniref:hypothetical protein n=1 Tax=Photobacterium sp. 1_MG-2023 TaxID=3062646 RepID=UPI0026E324FC|nr:hypothetical protein [Photobacterium sp. 1_MG-2023]MDO6705851.1 hypothetical protein [Photobacterium sp. 1_MG-2023]
MKTLWIGVLCLSLVIPAVSWAHGGKGHHYDDDHRRYHKHKHKHKKKHWHKHHYRKNVHHHYHRDVVVVHERPRREYHRSNLPDLVTFAVISGMTYAIIDNAFYKQSGERYIYTPHRP